MFDRRKIWAAALATLVVAAAPGRMQGQTSELPLQAGQVQQEEVAKLVAVLQSKDAADYDRAMACKRLAVIGTNRAVPALAALLSDDKFGHYARYGLEPIPDPAVDAALREAMGRLKGKLLVGVINSIGNRQDAEAVEGLGKLLADSDPDVAAAAAAALGRIGNARAFTILRRDLSKARTVGPEAVSPGVAEASLACAERLLEDGSKDEALSLYRGVSQTAMPKHLRVAALYGEVRALGAKGLAPLGELLASDDKAFFGVALRMAREIKGDHVTQTLVYQLDLMPPERQALMLLALGDRGDKAALPRVLEAAKAGPAEVRVAAIRSLLKLPDASVVPLLVDAAVEPDEAVAQAAQDSLAGLPGEEADAAVVAGLETGDVKTRRVMIDVAGRRRVAAAVPALVEAADDPNRQIRIEAVKALGTTVGPEGLPALTSRLIAPKTPEETAAVQEALNAACIRMPDRDACAEKLADCLPGAPVAAKCFLLDLLGSVGGAEALAHLSAAARDADVEIQDAATRILGEWLSADAAPELLELAKTLPNNKFKIRALRGYVRIARQLDVSEETRLAICSEALAAAGRDDERKLVLEVLVRNPSAGALSLAVGQLASPTLKRPASAAAVSIAEKIVEAHPDAVAKAMNEVIRSGARGKPADQAKTLLNRAKK